MTRMTRSAAALLGAAALAVLPACGGAATAGGDGPLAGASFVVGAKDFAEQNILAELTAQLLQAQGAEAEATEIKGSINTRKALEAGEVDIYWEYTGTAWVTYLGETTPLSDPGQQYDAVSAADLERNGITWLPPAEFNNTYALAVRTEAADELGVRTLSDLARLAQERPADATVCVESEFAAREDGFPGLLRTYGISLPPENVMLLDTGLIYTETDKGTCNFGEVFATDGRITALDLAVLEDDKNFFPVYQGAATLKDATLQANPAIADVLAPLTAKLDTATIRTLNARVDVDGEDPADVAEDWLTQEGLL